MLFTTAAFVSTIEHSMPLRECVQIGLLLQVHSTEPLYNVLSSFLDDLRRNSVADIRYSGLQVIWQLRLSHVNTIFHGCGSCIFDGAENAVGPCAQIWMHGKEPQVVKISGALHYSVSYNHMVILGH